MPASERSCGGQAETDGFDGLGLKTISGGWFPGFGRKTGGGLRAVKVRAEGTQRHLRACFEAKGSRRGAVPVEYVYQNMDCIGLVWVVTLIN